MPATRRQRLEARFFDGVLGLVATLARAGARRPVAAALRAAAAGVRRSRDVPDGTLPVAEVARQWQRMMPNRSLVPVTAVTETTAYAEIRGACPLRGTGDLAACHALMAYDRALVGPSGARFVVLASQAEPGRTHCEVAMRPAALPHDDLVAAHLQTGTPSERGSADPSR